MRELHADFIIGVKHIDLPFNAKKILPYANLKLATSSAKGKWPK